MHHKLTPLALVLALAVAPLMGSVAQAVPRGKLYVIGMGPAGPATATIQALQKVRDVDAVLAYGRERKLFATELKGKTILFDHIKGLWDYKGRFFTTLSPADLPKFKAERARLTKERVAKINAMLAQGKNLGMLEGGSPMVFSSCHWYTERLDPKDVVYIPGMGSASAAMAAVGRSVIPAHQARFLLQSAPFIITDEHQPNYKVFKDLAPYQPTMIFYMALKKARSLLCRPCRGPLAPNPLRGGFLGRLPGQAVRIARHFGGHARTLGQAKGTLFGIAPGGPLFGRHPLPGCRGKGLILLGTGPRQDCSPCT